MQLIEVGMRLEDRLQVCLLSLASRYPKHVVDMNEAVLGSQCFGCKGWLALDMIELLEQTEPELLQAMSRLVVDCQRCEIYLTDCSEITPAFTVHCRGIIPSCEGSMLTRQKIVRGGENNV